MERYVASASTPGPTRIPLTVIDISNIVQSSVSYDLSAARPWNTPCQQFGARLAIRTVRVIVVRVVLVELGYLACGYGSPLRAVLENSVVLWVARGTGRVCLYFILSYDECFSQRRLTMRCEKGSLALGDTDFAKRCLHRFRSARL